jgi:hypothetical protein
MSAWMPYGTIVVPEVDTRSQWLRDTLAARAADAAKGVRLRVVNAAVKAPVRVKKAYKPKVAKVGRPVIECPLCSARMYGNPYGICYRCCLKWRAFIEQRPLEVCAHPGCLKTLRKSCKWGRCEKHSNSLRSQATHQRNKENNAKQNPAVQ